MLIEIVVEPKRSIRWPKMKLSVNDRTIHDDFCIPNKQNYFIIEHVLEDPAMENVISLTHYDKDGRETIVDDEGETISDRAIILKSIKIEKHPVPEVVLYDKAFNVKYTRQQLKENPKGKTSIKNNLYFGYNGTYQYRFGNDGQKHYFENLIEKERLANIYNKKTITRPDGKVVEAFEFTGKLVEGGQKEAMTIEELHKTVNNAD